MSAKLLSFDNWWNTCETGLIFWIFLGLQMNKVSWISDMVRVWWWPVILLELMWADSWWRSLLHLLFVAITYRKVSLWPWKSPENLGIFSPTLWPPWLSGSTHWSHFRCCGIVRNYHIQLQLFWLITASSQGFSSHPLLLENGNKLDCH